MPPILRFLARRLISVPVTLLIFFAIAWNLAGDSLNDALNPRRLG